MPKGPVKTPFTDYVVGKGDWKGDQDGYFLAGDASDTPLLIGLKIKGVTGDLLEDMGKGK